MTHSTDDFVCAGYFLIREGMSGDCWIDKSLLPRQIISLSSCICKKFTASWFYTPQSPDEACLFDPALCDFDRYEFWCSNSPHAPKVGSPFLSVDDARACIRELNLNTDGLWLIGAGYPRRLLIEFPEIAENKIDQKSLHTINGLIKQQLSLELGGKYIGFDLAFQWSSTDFDCSWLCFGDSEDIFPAPEVTFNQHQLFADIESVLYAHQRQTLPPGEDEYLDYWLLMSYPLIGE